MLPIEFKNVLFVVTAMREFVVVDNYRLLSYLKGYEGGMRVAVPHFPVLDEVYRGDMQIEEYRNGLYRLRFTTIPRLMLVDTQYDDILDAIDKGLDVSSQSYLTEHLFDSWQIFYDEATNTWQRTNQQWLDAKYTEDDL